MKQLKKRLTYANVMSSIAVFLVLGGATAVAASHLGKNSVGSKQLKKNAVTAAKIKNNAITTSKLKNGAVTGAKVNAASLGNVPSATSATSAGSAAVAANLSGLSRKGVVRANATIGGTEAAALSAAPEIPLASTGSLSLYAKCVGFGTTISGGIYIRTTVNGAIFHGEDENADGSPTFLNTGTSEEKRRLGFEAITGTGSAMLSEDSSQYVAMSPDGTGISGFLLLAVRNGVLPEGSGIFGDSSCVFGTYALNTNG